MPQWAVNRLSAARLKITANDFFRVVFNGHMLKVFEVRVYYDDAFLEYDVTAKVRGANEAVYQICSKCT